jgi:hypothetical protein
MTMNDTRSALGSEDAPALAAALEGAGPDESPPGSAGDGHLIRFRTATGSLYQVDLAAMTWRRTPTLRSGRLRTESGALVGLCLGGPGMSAVLLCAPFADEGPPRVIVTSEIVVHGVAASADDEGGPIDG